METKDGLYNEYNSLPIVKSIETNTRKQIVLLQVIPDGIRNYNVIFVTKSEQVYSFGDNTDGCLGVGHNKPVLDQPSLIKELKGKQVVQLATGNRFVLALTRFGEIWSWGDNSCGQLALQKEPDNEPNITVPHQILSPFPRSCPITRISCGADFGAVVSIDGYVCTFGSNSCGQLALSDRFDYMSQLAIVEIDEIQEISCGANHLIMVTMDRRTIFAAGDNRYCQLGSSLRKSVYEASEIVLPLKPQETVKTVACGKAHTLILLSSGIVYAIGDNRQGQLATRLEDGSICSGNLHLVQMGEMFEQIYCVNLSNISVAKSATRKDRLYVWGPIKSKHAHRALIEQSAQWQSMCPSVTPKSSSKPHGHDSPLYILVQPRLSYITSVAKLFSLYEPTGFSYSDKLSNTHKGRPSAISKWFNKKEQADVQFKIGNQNLHAHKTVLVTYSDYFYRYFDFAFIDKQSSSNITTIRICDYSYQVFRAYLSYIYLGSIYETEVNKADPPAELIRFLVQLAELALTYEETDLYEECMQAFSVPELMCPRWVTHIYQQAYQYQVDTLVNQCLQFMLVHWEQMLEQPNFERYFLAKQRQSSKGESNADNKPTVSSPKPHKDNDSSK